MVWNTGAQACLPRRSLAKAGPSGALILRDARDDPDLGQTGQGSEWVEGLPHRAFLQAVAEVAELERVRNLRAVHS
jgi:hypothetical protein